MHSQAKGKSYNPDKEPMNAESGDSHELHDHGDGSFHTVHQGEQVEHESLGHALIHMAKTHAEEGHKHFHAHHDGMSMKSHSASAGEEPESREHEDVGGAHQHMDEAMEGSPTEDEGEGDPMGEKEPQGKGLGGLY
jgi:hypothetical protein